MTGLVQAIDTPAVSWIPLPIETHSFAARPFVAPAAPADILAALRRAVGLAPPVATVTVREPARRTESHGDFARSVESNLTFLRNAARRWSRDKAEADDLVQDTVVQALANAHLWRADQPNSTLRGWLFTIMRNRFLAGVAQRKRADATLDAIAAADACVPAAPARAEARLIMRDLERAMKRLPHHQQTAIRLVGIDGHSYEKAAQLMDITIAAVRCHLSRGRERLRDMVEGRIASPLRSRPLQPLSAARRGAERPGPAMHPEYA